MLAINTSNKRDPLTRPVERTRILDWNESEVSFREPLAEEALRILNVIG
jgi:hypothetical protein